MKSQEQLEFPLFKGEALTQLPEDLFIPPEALEIYLEDFSGPMDVLLYLIQKKDIDILELDLSEITDQYIQYIELMDALKIELAADYLVMAATLAQIKSRMLIPQSEDEEEEGDPRSELIRRLQEYQRYKSASESISNLPRLDRDFFLATSATFLDGSIPRQGILSDAKFCNIMPSLLPISTTKESLFKFCNLLTEFAKCLKCSFM